MNRLWFFEWGIIGVGWGSTEIIFNTNIYVSIRQVKFFD